MSITSGGGDKAPNPLVGWRRRVRKERSGPTSKYCVCVACVCVRAYVYVGMRLNLPEDQPFVSPSSDFYARCRASISRSNVLELTSTPNSIYADCRGRCLQEELHNYSIMVCG